jgi:hypothetical protein
MNVARMSVLDTGRLYPQEIPVVPIYVRDWVLSPHPHDHSAAGRIKVIKNLK